MNLGSVFHRNRGLVSLSSETSGGIVTSSTDASSYVGTSAVFGADELGVLFVAATGTTAAGSITSTANSYTRVASLAYNSGVDTLYIFVSNSLYGGLAFGNTYADTITFLCTGDAATGCVMSIVRVNNMAKTGSSAVVQIASDTNNVSGTPAPTFASAVNTNNPTYGVMGNGASPATMTAPTGWTEIRDTGYTSPTSGFENVRRFSGFTGTTVTWGSSSATPYGALVIELDWS